MRADDPAVWIHPRDPGLSLVMDGAEQQVIPEAAQPNNVDVLYGFKLEGRTVDLAVASLQASKKRGTRGVKVWAIDATTRRLSDVTQGGSIRVLGGKKPYGLCGYRSARTGRFYVFVTDERGRVEQYELTDGAAGGSRERRSAASPWGRRPRAAWRTTSWDSSTSRKSGRASGNSGRSPTRAPLRAVWRRLARTA